LHLVLIVVVADSGSDLRQLVELPGTQLDAISRGVLLDSRNLLGSGNRRNVIALRQDPPEGNLSWRCADFGGYCLDLVDGAQIALKVLALRC
jgi:hypothetical protein